jgi:hypothetical protein
MAKYQKERDRHIGDRVAELTQIELISEECDEFCSR